MNLKHTVLVEYKQHNIDNSSISTCDITLWYKIDMETAKIATVDIVIFENLKMTLGTMFEACMRLRVNWREGKIIM